MRDTEYVSRLEAELPRARGRRRELLEAQLRMAREGFERVVDGSCAQVLARTFPESCVRRAPVRYVPGFRRKRSSIEYGYYFRSPRPELDLAGLVELAQWLRRERRCTLTAAVQALLALTSEELTALLVTRRLLGGETNAR